MVDKTPIVSVAGRIPPPALAEPTAPWQTILDTFNLPPAKTAPSGVVGGWSHHVWRVNTISGDYAIKELVKMPGDWWSNQITVAVATEKTAWLAETIPMAEPIPAHTGSHIGIVTVDSTEYLYRCHRWVDGLRCAELPPAPARSASIGASIARIANLTIDSGTTGENLTWNALDAYEETVEEAVTTDRDWAPLLSNLHPLIEQLRSEFENLRDRRIPMLTMHKDVDPKNAIQQENGAVALIDWDCAGPALPATELLNAALSFAGGYSHADENCIHACIDAYAADANDLIGFKDAAPLLVEEQFGWIMVNAWGALGHRCKTEAQREHAAAIIRTATPELFTMSATIYNWAHRLD